MYELCVYPTALFDNPCVPRLANWAALADSLRNHIQIPTQRCKSNPLYVLDGGALLHRIPWSRDVSKISVMTTSVTSAASIENVLSYLMATFMARL